jgi:hypothetical protein
LAIRKALIVGLPINITLEHSPKIGENDVGGSVAGSEDRRGTIAMRTQRTPSWWRTPVLILEWFLVLAFVYAYLGDRNGNLPAPVYLVLGILAFTSFTGALRSKLDAILWKLEDIEQRLPPNTTDYQSELPLPNTVESYQQQWKEKPPDTVESYQQQWKVKPPKR